MVNFIIIVDPDVQRRRLCVKKIQGGISPLENLTVSSCSSVDFCAVWAAGIWTPVSHVADDTEAAIVFGDAIGHAGKRLDAEQLRALWGTSKPPEASDGFHVGIVYDSRREVIVEADLLGLFPVYYYVSDEVVLVSSSPEMFRFHPCFKAQFSPEGFVGIFLTKGLVEGQTLFRGVKRLTPGHLLKCHLGKTPKEVAQFELPVSTKFFSLKISEQVELLDKALKESVAHHAPEGERHCFMLSGGLDSTLLGGYLAKRRKRSDVLAVTEGLPTDNEMQCAKRIAEALGFEHVGFDVGYDDYLRFADLAVDWQHLTDGFTALSFWGFSPHLRTIAPRVITGFMGDGILGSTFGWAHKGTSEQVSFETYLDNVNRWVFRPKVLRRLLRQDVFDDLVSKTLQTIRKSHEKYSGHDFQKIWCYALHNRLRFHDASGLWALSFGAWPVLPFEDRKVLETVGGMPLEALAERKIEKELFIKKFPNLARLPLSRTDFDTAPLIPSPWHKGKQQIYGNVGIWKFHGLRRLRSVLLIGLRGERRYWSRSSYFGSPGWKALRKKTEPYLRLTSGLLHDDEVSALMPKPNDSYLVIRSSMARTGMLEDTGFKTLIGIALWLQKNPDILSDIEKNRKTL